VRLINRAEASEEIEITPEMIEAGADAIRFVWDNCAIPEFAVSEMAIAAYRAMAALDKNHADRIDLTIGE
jgi:hypothetical protein